MTKDDLTSSAPSAEDARLFKGGGPHETLIPAHLASPTVVTGPVLAEVRQLSDAVLEAYVDGSRRAGRPFSHLVGLDVAIAGEIGRIGGRPAVLDVEPVLLEGPFCNGLPCCPSFLPVRLERQANARPTANLLDPARALDRLIRLLRQIHSDSGRSGDPVVGVLTMAPEDCFEDRAHRKVVAACRKAGLEAYRLAPGDDLRVGGGRLAVAGREIDLVYRRIERSRIFTDFGEILGRRIVEETEETLWTNDPASDDLRSKVFEEQAFRRWEARTGRRIPRPRTLIGGEVDAAALRELLARGGFVTKEAASSGGRGVRLVFDESVNTPIFKELYHRFDGPHMTACREETAVAIVERAARPETEGIVQQLRVLDARPVGADRALVYDLRILALFDPVARKWELVSGFSRVVPCGKEARGNTLLTNVSAGAHLTRLLASPSLAAESAEGPRHGPLMESLHTGTRHWIPSSR